MENPYRTLGVSPNASKSEIKSKYRELCRVYHPDSSTGDAEMFRRVSEAWKQINSSSLKPVLTRRRWHHVSLFTIKEVV